MNKEFNLYTAKAVVFTLLFTLTMLGCSSSAGNDEDELEPVGFVIKTFDNNQNGANVVEYVNGNVSGSLQIVNGSSASFNVVFVAPDGTEFTPDPAEHSVEHVLEAQQQVASLSVPQSPVGPYEFTITGLAEGSTNLVIRLLHEGASELVSPNIGVSITAQQP